MSLEWRVCGAGGRPHGSTLVHGRDLWTGSLHSLRGGIPTLVNAGAPISTQHLGQNVHLLSDCDGGGLDGAECTAFSSNGYTFGCNALALRGFYRLERHPLHLAWIATGARALTACA